MALALLGAALTFVLASMLQARVGPAATLLSVAVAIGVLVLWWVTR